MIERTEDVKEPYACRLLYKTKEKGRRASQKVRMIGRMWKDLQTSYRALRTENGFSMNPMATRVVAPAKRFPEFVNTGRTEVC